MSNLHSANHNAKPLVFLLLVLVLRITSESTANLSFFLIAAWAMFGRVQAVQALSLVWLCSMLNSAVAPEASLAAVGRYAVFASAAISAFFESTKTKRGSLMTLATIFLGLALLVHSLFVSPIVDVSALKVISWSVVTATLFAAWSNVEIDERRTLEAQLFWGLVAILLLSLPMLVIATGVCSKRNRISRHSQPPASDSAQSWRC
jgi:hypothetical protein